MNGQSTGDTERSETDDHQVGESREPVANKEPDKQGQDGQSNQSANDRPEQLDGIHNRTNHLFADSSLAHTERERSPTTKARAGEALLDVLQRHLSEFGDGTNDDPVPE
jgi:hypothetical protein